MRKNAKRSERKKEREREREREREGGRAEKREISEIHLGACFMALRVPI